MSPARPRPSAWPAFLFHRQAKLPLMGLYPAHRLWRQIGLPAEQESTPAGQAACEALAQAMQPQRLGQGGEALLRQALSGMPKAVLPFRRAEADVIYAAAMVGHCRDFILRGEGTRVDAGFFQTVYGSVTYVEAEPTVARARPEMLEPGAVGVLCQALQAWGRQPVQFLVPHSGRALLHIPLGLNPHTAVGDTLRLQASVRRFHTPGNAPASRSRSALSQYQYGVTSQSLGEWVFTIDEAGLSLLVLRPELLMELNAALASTPGHDTAWLLLEGEEVRLLGPLPDLTEPGSTRPAWAFPGGLISRYLMGEMKITREVPMAHAVDLMHTFPWLVPLEADEWVEAAHHALYPPTTAAP